MKKFAAVSKILERVLYGGAVFLLILLVAGTFVEVISRYFFRISHGYIQEFVTWFMVWIAYLVIGIIQKKRKNVNVDVLVTKISERHRPLLLIFFDIVGIVFAILLGLAGIQHSQLVKQFGYTSPVSFNLPLWIVKLCVPLGALFLAFFSLEQLVVDIASLIKRGRKEKES